MRMRTSLFAVAGIAFAMGLTSAHADSKSDFLTQCNPTNSPYAKSTCECTFKAIDSSYGMDTYNKMKASGQLTDKAKDPKVQQQYQTAITACAQEAQKNMPAMPAMPAMPHQ